MYHYVLTREYPYTVGCFRGTPVRAQARFAGGPGGGMQGGPPEGGGMGGGLGGGPGKGPGGMRQPPAEALTACAGLSSGAPCRFTSPRGDAISGTCRAPGDALACVPERR
jgi:hypothetical protein